MSTFIVLDNIKNKSMIFIAMEEFKGSFKYGFQSRNGEFIIMSTRAYRSLNECRKAIEMLQHVISESSFCRAEDSGDNPFFILISETGRKLAESLPYNSHVVMENDIIELQKCIAAAPIHEQVA